MTKLSLRAIEKVFEPDVPALRGLDLDVEPGELMVLLGPSGCGKTTALRVIAGLETPTAGDVCFDGESVLAVPPEKRGAVMVFQENALFPFKTVGENMAFGLRMRKVGLQDSQARVTQALESVQLVGYEDRWPDQLSGGQRQRVALARALVVRPRLLLLDEPLSSLDPELREDLGDTIRRVQRDADITAVFVTHDQREALTVADRIALMIDGRIRQVGRPNEFFQAPVDREVASFFRVQPGEGAAS